MFPTDLEVEALVASMDEDKSGQIELQELVKHMGLQVGILISRSQISEIPGIISHIQIQLRSKLNPEKDFADAFKVFDRDGKLVSKITCIQKNHNPLIMTILIIFLAWSSGYISCSELKRVLTQRGQMPLSLQEVSPCEIMAIEFV